MRFARLYLVFITITLVACNKFEEGEQVFINIPGKSYLSDSKATGQLLDTEDEYALVNISEVTGNPGFSKLDFAKDVKQGKSALIPIQNLLAYIDGEKYWLRREQAAEQLTQALQKPRELWRLKDLQLAQIKKFLDEYDHADIDNTLSLIELNRDYFSDLNDSVEYELVDEEFIETWLENLPGYYEDLKKLTIKFQSTEELSEATEKFKKSLLGLSGRKKTLNSINEEQLTQVIAESLVGLASALFGNKNQGAFVNTAVIQAKGDLQALENVIYQLADPQQLTKNYEDYEKAFIAITSFLSLDASGDSIDEDELESLYKSRLASALRARIAKDQNEKQGYESIASANEAFEHDKEMFEAIEDEIGQEIFSEQIRKELYLKPTTLRTQREARIQKLRGLKKSFDYAAEGIENFIQLFNNYNQSIKDFPTSAYGKRIKSAKSNLSAVQRAIRYISDRNPSVDSIKDAESNMTAFVSDFEALLLLSESYVPSDIYNLAEQQNLYQDQLALYSKQKSEKLAELKLSITSHKTLLNQIATLKEAQEEIIDAFNKHRNQSNFPTRAIRARLNDLKNALRSIKWSVSSIDPLNSEGESFIKVSGYVEKATNALTEANVMLQESTGQELKSISKLRELSEQESTSANLEIMGSHQALLENYEAQKLRLDKINTQYEQLKTGEAFPRKTVSDHIYKAKMALRNLPYNIKNADPLNQNDKHTEVIKAKLVEAKPHLEAVEQILRAYQSAQSASNEVVDDVTKTKHIIGDNALASYKKLMSDVDAAKQRQAEVAALFESHKAINGYPVKAVSERLYKANLSLNSLEYNIERADPLNTQDKYRIEIQKSLDSTNEHLDVAQKLAKTFGASESRADNHDSTANETDNSVEPLVKKHTNDESGSNTVVDIVPEKSEKISGESPSEKGEAYTLESKISTLLKLAEKQFKANHLTSPSGDCAVETYNKVLELNASNTAAVDGLNSVAEKYAYWGNSALQKGDIAKAHSYLSKAKSVVISNQQVIALENSISHRLTQEKEISLAQEASEENGNDVSSSAEPPEASKNSQSDNQLSAGQQFKKDLNTLKDTVGGAIGKIFSN